MNFFLYDNFVCFFSATLLARLQLDAYCWSGLVRGEPRFETTRELLNVVCLSKSNESDWRRKLLDNFSLLLLRGVLISRTGVVHALSNCQLIPERF